MWSYFHRLLLVMQNFTLIKNKRVALGFSQEWVADQVGVSQSHYCRLEKGKAPIHASLLNRIAGVLGIPAEALQPTSVRESAADTPGSSYHDAMLAEKELQISRLVDEVLFLRRQIDNNRGHDSRGYPDGPGPLYTA
jgi:transcriptional regulator with XRE-family HTH domain